MLSILSDKHTRVFYDSEKRLKAQIKRAVCRISDHFLLPARASEQGNVIGLVSVYIYMYICVAKIRENVD